METLRCPLCYISVEYGVIDHLGRDHRWTEFEARALVERSKEGSLGWNAEGRRVRPRPSLTPAKVPLPRGTRSAFVTRSG
jgi:hypothetical protein